jgi:hypothetical protein
MSLYACPQNRGFRVSVAGLFFMDRFISTCAWLACVGHIRHRELRVTLSDFIPDASQLEGIVRLHLRRARPLSEARRDSSHFFAPCFQIRA